MILNSALTAIRHSGILSLMATLFVSLFLLSFSTDCAQSQGTDKKQSGTLYPIIQNGRFGFIDSKGRVVIKPQFLVAFAFSEGLAAVAIGKSQRNWVGFVDTTGRIVFETDGSPSEKSFSCGVAALLANSSSSHYYVDKKGKWIAGYYADAKDCTEGLCAVRTESMGPRHWGYINTAGAIIVKGQYDWAMPFSEGIARVGIMTGEPYLENAAPAADGKQGYIDHSGRMITPLRFDKAWDFSDGMAQVKLGDRWGFINQTGDLVIAPEYEDSHAFKGGLAAVKVNGRWGFIDKSGAMIITARFDSVDDFSEDWAAVKFAWRAFYVDRTGRTVLSTPFEKVGSFRNGRAIVGLNNKAGLIDKEGKIIFNLQSSSLEFISDELIRVQDREKGIGYINYNGETIWKQTY
jgi:hypothetical protein